MMACPLICILIGSAIAAALVASLIKSQTTTTTTQVTTESITTRSKTTSKSLHLNFHAEIGVCIHTEQFFITLSVGDGVYQKMSSNYMRERVNRFDHIIKYMLDRKIKCRPTLFSHHKLSGTYQRLRCKIFKSFWIVTVLLIDRAKPGPEGF